MLKFEVLTTQWTADEETFAGGVHEIAKPSAALLGMIAAAEAAGSVVVIDAADDHRKKLDSAVQSQEAGEAAYAAAQADGSWHEGNLMQFELDVASGVRDGEL
jgi:hypothetical protein